MVVDKANQGELLRKEIGVIVVVETREQKKLWNEMYTEAKNYKRWFIWTTRD